MGEFKDRSDQIFENLLERLHEEGYEDITSSENNAVVDLIKDHQLEDYEAFKKLVKDSIKIIEEMRSH